MQNTGKKLHRQASGKSCFSKRDIGSRINTSFQNKNGCKVSYTKRCKPKPRSHVKTIGSVLSKRRASEFSNNGTRNNSFNGKPIRRKTLQKVSDTNSSDKKLSSMLRDGKSSILSFKGHGKNTGGDVGTQKIDKGRKQKRRKKNGEHDEASRLQRRTRYLLIKMKLEQNLIDAYSGEGWKGQSREKIKPEKELQRATKQILKCKLGIRDAIRQLDLLSSEGCIEDSVLGPDGSVYHEHIFCAKCKLRDAFPDNDIILCDGTCNCAFHQKCLEPPLATENIPPGDQGWFCKFCECKMEILEAVNAHLGTHFSANSNWQDIFKDAAAAPDGENTSLNPGDEWPSDDSEDDDYDPDINEKSCSYSRADTEENMSDDASSSSSLFWTSEEEASPQNGRSGNGGTLKGGYYHGKSRSRDSDKINLVDSIISIDSDDTTDREITSCRRQRRDVDYKKLHDEMFGKDVPENEQVSEDEDWGPGRRKRRGKESDAAGTLVALCGLGDGRSNVIHIEAKNKLPSVSEDKKTLFRIPPNAVEKLRRVFAENELPSRAVRENLSKQLGLASEKVNKWFKNARYTALKIRKAKSTKQLHTSVSKESSAATRKNRTADRVASNVNSYLVPLTTGSQIPKNLRKVHRRKNPKSMTALSKKQQKRAIGALPTNINEVSTWLSNAVSLKKQMTSLKRKASLEKKRVHPKCEIGTSYLNETKNKEQLYLVEMERLCCLDNKLEKLKEVLLRICNGKNHVSDETHLDERLVIYVPVAELREKV